MCAAKSNEEQNQEHIKMAPCRLALKSKTSCPECCRPMSIKTLKYQHKCGRTWDVAQRAAEEERKAYAHRADLRTAEAQKPKYANLIAQIY